MQVLIDAGVGFYDRLPFTAVADGDVANDGNAPLEKHVPLDAQPAASHQRGRALWNVLLPFVMA